MEILTVIGIIIVLSLMAFLVLKNYQKFQDLKNSTKDFIGRLKLAQQYSVTEQIKYAVRIDLLNNSYYLIKKSVPEEVISSFLMSESVNFSSLSGLENNEAVFNPTGAIDFPGDVFLTHELTQEQTKVSLKPSGYVTWEMVE